MDLASVSQKGDRTRRQTIRGGCLCKSVLIVTLEALRPIIELLGDCQPTTAYPEIDFAAVNLYQSRNSHLRFDSKKVFVAKFVSYLALLNPEGFSFLPENWN